MPRYFFHVSGISTFNDVVGAELVNAAAAWSVAVVSCGEILTDLDGKMPDRSEVRITVKDQDDCVIAVVRFTGERQSARGLSGEQRQPVATGDVQERVVAAIDSSLAWISDVHNPKDFSVFASDLANAALASLEEGDYLRDGLVIRRETIQ